MTRIWTAQEERNEVLRPVLPLVVYHGDRAWRVATDFQALFAVLPAALRPYLPQFDYLLSDFSWRAEQQLRGDLLVRAVLLVLRAAYAPAERQQLLEIAEMLVRLERESPGLEIVRAILYYMYEGADRIDRSRFNAAMIEAGEKGSQLMGTMAQYYRDEGIALGIEQGIEQGLRDSIVTLLEARFGALPGRTAATLAQIDDPDTLRQLVRTAGMAATPDAFAAILAELAES